MLPLYRQLVDPGLALAVEVEAEGDAFILVVAFVIEPERVAAMPPRRGAGVDPDDPLRSPERVAAILLALLAFPAAGNAMRRLVNLAGRGQEGPVAGLRDIGVRRDEPAASTRRRDRLTAR